MQALTVQKKSTPIVNWLRRQVRDGFAPIVVICGRQRSGKTSAALRFAYELYPKKFKYDRLHFTKDVEEFAIAYSQLKNDIIILDEASDSLYVYDWNSLFQKVFSIINDTQAFRNNIVIIILPQVHKLGKLHRYDVDVVLQVMRSKNPITHEKETFYKYLAHIKQYSDMAMRPPRMMHIGTFGPIPMPPENIWRPYIDVEQAAFKEEILQKKLQLIVEKLSGRKETVKPISVL